MTENCRGFKVVGHLSFPLVTVLKTKTLDSLGMYDFLTAWVRILAFSLRVFSDSVWKGLSHHAEEKGKQIRTYICF